jgi:hypothetical protein
MATQQERNKIFVTTNNEQLVSKEIDNQNHNISNSVDKVNSINKEYPNMIDIDKAIIVSDLHLGYEKCNSKAFLDFLLECILKDLQKNIPYLFLVIFGIFGENMISSTQLNLMKFCA